jgi:hypothetical protein
MANQRTVIWTALPNGFARDNSSKLRLSLLATIQLKGDGTKLSDFGITNWTEEVKGYQFVVDVGGQRPPVTIRNDFDTEMWTALFGQSSSAAMAALTSATAAGPPIKSYKRPETGDDALSNAEVLSYDVDGMGSEMLERYKNLANQMTRFQSVGTVNATLSTALKEMTTFQHSLNIYLPPDATEDNRLQTLKAVDEMEKYIAGLDDARKVKALGFKALYLDRISRNGGADLHADVVKGIEKQIQDKVGPGTIILFTTAAPPPVPESARFIGFHAPLERANPVAAHMAPAQSPPNFDFHDMLTMLSNYPVLMRRLGLVIELEFDEAGIPDAGDPTVSVVKAGPSSDPQPKTRYKLDRGRKRFLPRPKTELIKDGLLNLKTGEFTIHTADVDGALMKNLSKVKDERVNSPQAAEADPLARLSDSEVPPAVRTLGISVIHKNRAAFLKDLLRKAEDKCTDPATCTFSAEDLIRGFRVDVYEIEKGETGNWYSLCDRTESYEFLDAQSKPSLSWPSGKGHDSEGTVNIGVVSPEVSQAVKAANIKVLQQHDSLFRWENWSLCLPFPQTMVDAKTRNVTPQQGTPLRLKPKFGYVEGTLPKLRFGRRYRLRCRIVDPAGNSLRKDEIDPQDFSVALGDPADQPFFFARHEPVNPPVVLVTSAIDPEDSPGEQLDRLVIRDGKSSSQRCVAPPRVSTMTAIIDGRYDNGTPHEASAFDGAQLNPESGEFPQVKAQDPAFENPIFRYQPANAQPPRQPYLPDPFAVGTCVGLSTVTDEPLFNNPLQNELDCAFYALNAEWPHAQPILIRLVAAEQAGPIARLYRVSVLKPFVTMAEIAVPRGEIVKLKLSCMLGLVKHEAGHDVADTTNLEKLALWRLSHPGGQASAHGDPKLQERIVCGDFPLYTPHRDVTLVHAVKKPLAPASANAVETPRTPGDTKLLFSFDMNLHRTSTGRVDCEAEWREPNDDVTQPKCIVKHGLGRPGELKVPLEGPLTGAASDPQRHQFTLEALHNFGDTKHRNVKYSLRATTRFREYYPPAPTLANERDETERVKLQGQEHERYTTIFKEQTINVLNTARPPAPNLAYVIPTFRWKQQVPDDSAPNSRRWGGGLRVYLERPWFATGEGELLGVVLYQGTLNEQLCKVMAPHVTQWGRDPIWGLKPTSGNSADRPFAAFPNKDSFRRVGSGVFRAEKDLTLEALKNLDPAAVGCDPNEEFRISVVGFQPEFDEERGLWRCDLEMDPGQAYFPFVRLALARFQPDSLRDENDCRLSAVVQAEFMQLTPDRFASMKYESAHRVTMTVTGFSYRSRSAAIGQFTDDTGLMKVAVEERCKDSKGSMRWLRISVNQNQSEYVEAKTSFDQSTGETTWTFDISLPRSRKVTRYRLVIMEYEEIAQDQGNDHVNFVDGRRIVYADVLGV